MSSDRLEYRLDNFFLGNLTAQKLVKNSLNFIEAEHLLRCSKEPATCSRPEPEQSGPRLPTQSLKITDNIVLQSTLMSCTFIGAFAKPRKATISFVMSVRMEQLSSD